MSVYIASNVITWGIFFLRCVQLLVTSNDSRIRLYNLKDHSLSCKYKGCLNTSSQIKATFRYINVVNSWKLSLFSLLSGHPPFPSVFPQTNSRDGQYIISGSEDNFVYVWKTHIDTLKMPSRRDRNEFYESFSCKCLLYMTLYNGNNYNRLREHVHVCRGI